jgi:DNA-binding response OmpR family regulator
MRILVADDDRGCGRLMGAALDELGHEPLLAQDGQQAWDLFQSGRPEIVITDWMMPKVDGLELVRMIRADARHRYTWVILLTALGGKGSYLEGMRAGADDFVTKPYDVDALAARLRVAERILRLSAQVTRLEGLLPICTYCKKIRDERQRWQPLDLYVAHRTDARFSHGICPECYEHVVEPMVADARRRGAEDVS